MGGEVAGRSLPPEFMQTFPEFTLVNPSGLEMRLTSYGCTVLSLRVPDRFGNLADVVLGFSELERYPTDSPHFGCVVGRFGNRIANGRFSLDAEEYSLNCNETAGGVPCHLHGGHVGFGKVLWDGEYVSKAGAVGVHFSRLSPDGEEGYPGNLMVHVTYWLTDAGDFQIDYLATTDRPTPVNLTHHTFFNLKGEGYGDILEHEVQIHADSFVPVGSNLIPLGQLEPVAGSALDFRKPHSIGARIEAAEEQLRVTRGYDHCWVMRETPGELLSSAFVYEPETGRTLEVLTTEPGVQFYTGNFLDGSLRGKSGRAYEFRGGFCFEPQHFPDSPNQSAFPSTILRPGQKYISTTVYRFGVA